MSGGAATVCILAAGRGTRVGAFGGRLHKALLPVGNVAVLTRIIRQFAPGTRFIVALGHLDAQVRDYLALMHPGLDVTLVPVDRIDGPGAGPGYSLSCCRAALPGPFVFTSCDTLVPGGAFLPPPDRNWVGVHPAENPERWCTVGLEDGAEKDGAPTDGLVVRFIDKSPDGSPRAFIGIAGVADPDRFWAGLLQAGDAGEAQVVPGLAALIPAGVRAVTLPWLDTGTRETYRDTLSRFTKNHTFEGKTTDVTYQDGDVVVKLFFDPAVSARRFARGAAHRDAFAPVLDLSGHAYSYRYVPGTLLSEGLDGPACRRLLDWLETRFWRPAAPARAAFDAACRRFYRDKTLDRLDAYLRQYRPEGEGDAVALNGRLCPPVRTLVEALPDAFHQGGLPSSFHGDLHADNVIVAGDGYVLIDWRDEFAGFTELGDRYYDLAKFFHTLDLSVATMESGGYATAAGAAGLTLSHDDTAELAAARTAFWAFVDESGYEARRIAILNGLVFIGMAPLYDRRMADYLYALGRLRLTEALN